VIAKFLNQYKKGQPLTVVGDGQQIRDFTHVKDICEGLFRISQMSHLHTDGIDLGRGEPLSILEVVKMFYDNAEEGRDFVRVPLRKGEPLKTEANSDSLERILGWLPQHNLFEYIDKEKIQ
jgi:nucleoside-diphosphate-sugar epimerase